MKKVPYVIMILFFVIAFFLHLLALLKVFSLVISVPLLFLSIFILIMSLNNSKRFRGF